MIWILKIFLRAALWVFCSDISINNKSFLKTKGPLLIIANHPNSFLDAIIIGTQYNRPVYFLARGDVFLKRHYRFLLGLLNMIPIYRQREGKEHLHLNEGTFNEATRLLKKGEAVLIFIEGICLNTHELQPFKKGAARILSNTQKEGVHPAIHIIGIGYNHFKGIGKKINISIQLLNNISTIHTAQERVLFNKNCYEILKQNIIPPTFPTLFIKTPNYYLHYTYYKLIYNWVDKKTKGTVFFDSVLFSLLFFTYPLFLLILFCVLYFFKTPVPIILLILLGILTLNKSTIKA